MYGKIFDTIFDSTINDEELHVRWTFAAFIILSDRNGILDKARNALARKINIPRPLFDEAEQILLAPDPDSRTKEHDGRRIELFDPSRPEWGCWRVLNKPYYRELLAYETKKEQTRERQDAQRERDQQRLFEALSKPDNAGSRPDNADNAITDVIYTHEMGVHVNAHAREDDAIGELITGINAWNTLAPTKLFAPKVTAEGSVRFIKRWREIRRRVCEECPGFTWPELIARLPVQKFLLGKSWFSFRWLLYAGRNGDLNATKAWFNSYTGDDVVAAGGSAPGHHGRGPEAQARGGKGTNGTNPFANGARPVKRRAASSRRPAE